MVAINTDKVQFCLPTVKVGGFLVSHGKYEIDPQLTEHLRRGASTVLASVPERKHSQARQEKGF